MTMSDSSWEKLVELLLDTSAEFGDRDDAAMDLRRFNGPEVEAALASVASSSSSDADLVDRCGESLADIWCRNGRVNDLTWSKLRPEAKAIAKAMVTSQRPDLLSRLG
jgi:hypothetical protein